ncbi:MAG TPA: TOBE domain-containing protein, partial [Ktedonobacterales bacterium]|nr:TOBE domain-containing protein [Ktedonobacterales bacterium]
IQGSVDVVEHLGNEQLLYVKVGSGVVLARVEPGVMLKAGDTVTFGVNDAKLHIFDPETTKALS